MSQKASLPHGLNTARKAKIESLKPKINELLGEGLNGYEIALKIDLPRSTLYNYIKEIRAGA